MRAPPRICLVLKDLAALNANARARAPRIYGFLKDLVTSNRGFPSKYHTSPRIQRFLKDLAALNHAFWRAHRVFPNKHRTLPCIYGFLKDLFRHWAFLPSAEITVFGEAYCQHFAGRRIARKGPLRCAVAIASRQ
jgi:hypothetical protein